MKIYLTYWRSHSWYSDCQDMVIGAFDSQERAVNAGVESSPHPDDDWTIVVLTLNENELKTEAHKQRYVTCRYENHP